MATPKHTEFYVDGILKHDIAVLSKAITLVESSSDAHRQTAVAVMEALMPYTGRSFRLGITGVPGVGKSTFIESFGQHVVAQGHRLAVLAIDPSSTRSRGSILGDKTRMEKLSAMQQVYIRPSPSSGELGGITRSTYESILLCEAAGFDYIIVETVGVGQSEVAVKRICDFFLLLMLAGAGDELQGIKRGIMEMADALVITKADGENAQKAASARAEYAHAMHLLQAPESGWTPRTLVCSALEGKGIEEVYNMLTDFVTFAKAHNWFFENRKEQQYSLFLNTVEERLRTHFFSEPGVKQQLEILKQAENFQPYAEALRLINAFFKSTK